MHFCKNNKHCQLFRCLVLSAKGIIANSTERTPHNSSTSVSSAIPAAISQDLHQEFSVNGICATKKRPLPALSLSGEADTVMSSTKKRATQAESSDSDRFPAKQPSQVQDFSAADPLSHGLGPLACCWSTRRSFSIRNGSRSIWQFQVATDAASDADMRSYPFDDSQRPRAQDLSRFKQQ